jgi:hypothetical protein
MSNRFPNRRWVIITKEEVTNLPVDFSKVMETSNATLRYSLNYSNTFVKYEGAQPSFLVGKTEHNHPEILAILAGSEWTSNVAI